MPPQPLTLAYFVSSHGFGHAARSAAVMEALHRRSPGVRFEIFTKTPEWFFDDSVRAPFTYHATETDVGLVQRSPVEEDPAATVAALERFLPLDPAWVERLAVEARSRGCRAVLADISPLGIAVARAAGLPSVLVENFTWDWIYGAYTESEPRLERFRGILAEIYAGATLRIQTEPVCAPAPGAVTVAPVSRPPRRSRAGVRRQLGVAEDEPLALLTMGGVGWRWKFLERLERHPSLRFVAFDDGNCLTRRGSLQLLPQRSPIYLPDLIGAADAVVGKLGYSTVAETWAAGARYAWVDRPSFPESPILAAFVRRHLPSVEILAERFVEGDWLAELEDLLEVPRAAAGESRGAEEVAGRAHRLIESARGG